MRGHLLSKMVLLLQNSAVVRVPLDNNMLNLDLTGLVASAGTHFAGSVSEKYLTLYIYIYITKQKQNRGIFVRSCKHVNMT